MVRQAVPASVRSFVLAHTRSLDELELLMTLIRQADRWWDVASVAAELRLSFAAAGSALDYFASRNLLDIRITGDVRYQFRPGTPELQQAARDTAEIYRSRPLDLARLIKTPASPSLSDFADAFRIRQSDDAD